MTRARDIANLVDANGDIVAGALDNVPASNDASALTTGTLPVARVPYFTNRNLVVNGCMKVNQRNSSVSDISGSGYYVQDRHRISMGNTAGRLRMSSSGVVPDGFASSLRLQCTTADTSIAASEDFSLQHRFEGQDLQVLKKGTAGAEQITVSFYMKTNKAFTFMCELDDTDNNRFNGQQFTTTTDWTRHVLTFAGDTTGALDNDNARSLMLSFWFHAGSNFTSGTYTANTWQSRQSTNVHRAVGIGSFFDSTDNEIRLTGLQMEIGSQVTPFEHRSFADELHSCKRYYQKSFVYSQPPVNSSNTTSNSYNGAMGGYCGSNNSGIYSGLIQLDPPMRATPTMTTYGNSNGHWGYLSPTNTGAVNYSAGGGYIGHIRENGFSVGQNISGNTLYIGFGQWTAEAEL